jgi:hypothetical protein
MTTDIERARKARIRDAKRAAHERWSDELSYSIEVTWPRSILGCFYGVLLILTPPAIVLLAIRITMGRKRGAVPR